jgi:hypothetical protein
MNAEGANSVFDISSTDTYFLPSAGLSDAHATYLAAALVLFYCAVMIWINRKNLG